MTYKSRQVSISIERSFADVYAFASNPENMPQWAEGLSHASIIKEGDEWIAESPMGKVRIKFSEQNTYGVLDHDVTLPSGEVNYNPLRVVKNGDGSEVIFTLYHLPGISDADFEKDTGMVQADLKRLKSILEAKS